jgi:hypothetical protein
MKTPRELLLERHRQANPQLDALRDRAVADMKVSRREGQSRFVRLAESCREFLRIPRIAWAGIGAAWTVIIALNIASSEKPATPLVAAATGSPKRSPEILQALREQKRLFAEMVGAAGEFMDAETPRFIPRPRSERSIPNAAA